uniref:DUF3496 domain-containing protein n=1 Tax=Amphiprion ocellaris TaxID=80972 RepID=A0AAQ5ZWG2_AMPOC
MLLTLRDLNDVSTDCTILYLTDSRSMVKLQNIFHEYERSIQKARSRHGYLADKVNQLEVERAEMKSSMEEVKDVKFQLKQEQENRRNATMMYNTTRDKLRRTEEQHQLEVQERQKVELTLRNLELEMRTLLEEDHSETQRLLAQERSARTLQENLLNSHLRKQQEIEEESKRNMSKSNEVILKECFFVFQDLIICFLVKCYSNSLHLLLLFSCKTKEASLRSHLEKVNGDLKDQLASLNSLNRSNDQLERSKRQLEEEVLDLRRRMEATQVEQSHVEQYRRDAEERARQEVQQKLEQVNLFLQVKSYHVWRQNTTIKDSKRNRSPNKRIIQLVDSTRTELERYRQLYAEELRLRKSLAAKLDRRLQHYSKVCLSPLLSSTRLMTRCVDVFSSVSDWLLFPSSCSWPDIYGSVHMQTLMFGFAQ